MSGQESTSSGYLALMAIETSGWQRAFSFASSSDKAKTSISHSTNFATVTKIRVSELIGWPP